LRPFPLLTTSEEEKAMTNEERQRTMDFIVTQQAQFAVNFDKAEVRVSRLERVVKLIIKAGLRTRTQLRERDESFERRMEALRESQAHSDKRLDVLIDIVREQRNGTP
jgi:hypothetical protein